MQTRNQQTQKQQTQNQQTVFDAHTILREMQKYCTLDKKRGLFRIKDCMQSQQVPEWVKETIGLVQMSFFLDTDDHPYTHMLTVVHIKNLLQRAFPDASIQFEPVLHFYSMLTLSDFYLKQLEEFLHQCDAGRSHSHMSLSLNLKR